MTAGSPGWNVADALPFLFAAFDPLDLESNQGAFHQRVSVDRPRSEHDAFALGNMDHHSLPVRINRTGQHDGQSPQGHINSFPRRVLFLPH